jgi:hypothetical protein
LKIQFGEYVEDESDTHKLQEGLDAAAKWENDWLMQFHPDKGSVIYITTNSALWKARGYMYFFQIVHRPI